MKLPSSHLKPEWFMYRRIRVLELDWPSFCSRVTAGGKGFQAGIKMGEQIVAINGQSTVDLVHVAAQKLIKNTGHNLELTLNRSSDTSKGLLTNINRPSNIFSSIERRSDPNCAESGETQDTIQTTSSTNTTDWHGRISVQRQKLPGESYNLLHRSGLLVEFRRLENPI